MQNGAECCGTLQNDADALLICILMVLAFFLLRRSVFFASFSNFLEPLPSALFCHQCGNLALWRSYSQLQQMQQLQEMELTRAHTHTHTHAIGRVIPEVTSLLESANPRANETNKRVNEIKAQRRFHLTGDRSAAVLRRCCVLGFLLCFHTKQAACTGVVRWPAYSSALEESS